MAYYNGREFDGGSSAFVTETVLTDFKETYDINGMRDHIINFEDFTNKYEEETRIIDNLVNDTINGIEGDGIDGIGLKGKYADSLLIRYDDLVKDFADFTQNYEMINNVIIIEDSLHTNFADEAAGTLSGGEGATNATYKPNYIRPSILGTPEDPVYETYEGEVK